MRDEVKRLKAVELAVMEDPTARHPSSRSGEGGASAPGGASAIQDLTASWPKPKGERRAGSKGSQPGNRAFAGPKR
jgi:hypothetical protein